MVECRAASTSANTCHSEILSPLTTALQPRVSANGSPVSDFHLARPHTMLPYDSMKRWSSIMRLEIASTSRRQPKAPAPRTRVGAAAARLAAGARLVGLCLSQGSRVHQVGRREMIIVKGGSYSVGTLKPA